MKRMIFAAAAAMTFVAAPAMAQVGTNEPTARTAPNTPAQGSAPVPSFQQGDNQQAGGPANELNSPTGVGRPVVGAPAVVAPPATTGTVVVPNRPNEPLARQQPTLPPGAGARVPDYQQGSNQQSGGPARELNRGQ